jgi:hypothetical protein
VVAGTLVNLGVKHEFLGDASATIDVRSAVRASIESLLAEFEICERSLMKLAREKEQRFPAIAKAAS